MSDKYIHLSHPASSPHIFGLGERNFRFDLQFNNAAYTIWNRDSPQDIEDASLSGGHNTYGSHPVYLMKDTNLTQQNHNPSSHFHLVYLQNINAMDIILTNHQSIEYHITGGILDFKIILCDFPAACIQRYHSYIGP